MAARSGERSRYYQPEIETASRSWIGAAQRDALGGIVDYALAGSAFTRELWDAAGVGVHDVRTVEDYVARAPLFTQSQVSAWGAAHSDPYGGLLCLPPGRLSLIAATSGTTGTPLALPQYPGNPRTTASCRDLWEEDLRAGDTSVLLLGPYRVGYLHPCDELMEEIGVRRLKLDAEPASAATVLAASRELGPVTLNIMTRGLLTELERVAEAEGADLAEAMGSYRSVTFGGEALDPLLRERLTSLFGSVRNHTGLGNTIAAVECREHDGSHVWEDLVLLEVLDPDTGEAVPEGEVGELVVTTLQERATPLLRFRTEDLVRYTSAPCACGRTHGRVWTLGRVGDGLRVGGRTVLPTALFPLVGAVEEARDGVFQFVVAADGSVTLRVGCRRGARDSAVVLADLRSALGPLLGDECAITLVDAADIVSTGTGIKFPRILRT